MKEVYLHVRIFIPCSQHRLCGAYLGFMLSYNTTDDFHHGIWCIRSSSGTQFARNRKSTEKQNSGLYGLYAVNCGGKKLGKTCPFPVLPAGASLPRLEPDEPPAELEADRNSAVKSPELSSDCGISGLKHKFITVIRACRFVR